MAYLKDKLYDLDQAVKTLEEALAMPASTIVRDAALLRYEYTFELLWKAIKVYLFEQHQIECISPKECFREAFRPFNLTEQEVELTLDMCKDRNLAVHTYNEDLATRIFKALPRYLILTKKLHQHMSEA